MWLLWWECLTNIYICAVWKIHIEDNTRFHNSTILHAIKRSVMATHLKTGCKLLIYRNTDATIWSTPQYTFTYSLSQARRRNSYEFSLICWQFVCLRTKNHLFHLLGVDVENSFSLHIVGQGQCSLLSFYS